MAPTYQNPVIPVGFTAIETDNASWQDKNNDGIIDGWNDGLVIKDESDNEYVFIPVDGGANIGIDITLKDLGLEDLDSIVIKNNNVVSITKSGKTYGMDTSDIASNVKYEKWNASVDTDFTVTKDQVEDDTLPSDISSENEQILKYQGFYVARYEASLPDDKTTPEILKTKLFTKEDNDRADIGKAQSKFDKIAWNNISYNNAKKVSENVISTDYVQSGLITGTQYDTVLKFLSQEVDVDSDSTAWGNYRNKYGYEITGYHITTYYTNSLYENSTYNKNEMGYLLLTTGKFGEAVGTGKPKNLYDVGGNLWEWTTETVKAKGGSKTEVGNKVIRGGSYNSVGYVDCASHRLGNGTASDAFIDKGFRFVLYVK